MILDVRPAKASQAMGPAWEKVAKHARIDFQRTIIQIVQHMERLEPMSDDEIALRVQMLEGTLDRKRLFPKTMGS